MPGASAPACGTEYSEHKSITNIRFSIFSDLLWPVGISGSIVPRGATQAGSLAVSSQGLTVEPSLHSQSVEPVEPKQSTNLFGATFGNRFALYKA